jgi:hypothetical protein
MKCLKAPLSAAWAVTQTLALPHRASNSEVDAALAKLGADVTALRQLNDISADRECENAVSYLESSDRHS